MENKCDICGKTFSHKWRLTAHVKDKHSAIGYKCDICSKDYSSKDSLAPHKKEYHSTSRFKCKLCGTVVKLERHMVQHVKNHNMVTDVKGTYEKVNGDENAAPVMNTARVDVMPPSTSASEMVTSPFSGAVAIPTSTSGMVPQPTSGADAVPMVASTSSQDVHYDN
ncbi:zinc finger protein 845-like [Periplaneta americana]|uniref:zinc finger protein 845-like n=1 Tax=Periplaneta americana TaxID=6978 RepID=UPI0037E78CC4